MSDTTNHKKAIAITRSCRGNRGLITDIYYKILEDHPAAIVNAFEAIKKVDGGFYECPKCESLVDFGKTGGTSCPGCSTVLR